MAKKNPIVEALAQASKGLLFPSETDAPLEPFLWEDAGDKLTKDKVRQLAGGPKGAAVEEVNLEDLLSTVPEEDRPQFDKLAAAVKQQLSGVKVYKVGDEPEKQVYLVGKTSDGQWAGLKTTVVET
jgi:histidine triad (HIT) family protein